MEFFAHHGCFEEEKLVGNYFYVTFGYEYNINKAAISDDILDTINYQQVYQIIKDEMAKPVNLLEHLACKIIDRIFYAFPSMESATIKIEKANPSMGGKMKGVSILVSKRREL